MCTCRRRSPWLFHMNSGSCNGCDIELVASLTPRYDAEQLGVRLEGSPRHADILCITGPVTRNAVGAIQTVYGQVCGPKAVVAIGSCPATTNVFIDSRTLDGPLNKHIPVDVFVPGCPPRPEALIQAFMTLQRKIDGQHLTGEDRPRHLDAEAQGEFSVPVFGEHDLEPTSNPGVWTVPVVIK